MRFNEVDKREKKTVNLITENHIRTVHMSTASLISHIIITFG